MISRLLLLTCVIIVSAQINSLGQSANAGRVQFYEYSELQERKSFQPFTALILRSNSPIDFTNYAILKDDKEIGFENDPHTEDGQDYYYSSILHFQNAQKQIKLRSNLFEENDITLIAVDGSYSFQNNKPSETESSGNCELPKLISQNEWRSSLEAPSYERTYTESRNLIVHHSAGSNTITDYQQAVRDIYLFHTQGRGWSDIGYNYIVAPDGAIFAGRDPGDGAQDLVMGAHFCGSNSNTMGICLLGNYEEVEPTKASLESLTNLLSWKVHKDSLNPLGTDFHPLNNDLAVIAGHRNGCSTLCPGENLFDRLQEIRLNVDSISSICSSDNDDGDDGEPTIPGVEENDGNTFVPVIVDQNQYEEVPNYTLFPNPADAPFQFNLKLEKRLQDDLSNVKMLSLGGKQIAIKVDQYENYLAIQPKPIIESGIYYLYIRFKDGGTVTKKVLFR